MGNMTFGLGYLSDTCSSAQLEVTIIIVTLWYSYYSVLLLSTVERVINLEGVTQFHCQVSRVFPKKGTERFYKGLENTFRQLYKQLGSPKSSNEVIMLCTECWLKMCALGGKHTSPIA